MTLRCEKVDRNFGDSVEITNPDGQHDVVLACEHASAAIPAQFHDLGLSPDARYSHIAWDPGALITAQFISKLLDAPLVHSRVSRLVYDCNRAPSSLSAMPETSEIYSVPGNRNLSEQERDRRAQSYYVPFRDALSKTLAAKQHPPVLVTIHSFTPNYHGRQREVEIGILHDSDTRLADALLKVAVTDESENDYIIRRNEPYGPDDDVTHTLQNHAIPANYLNVMIEIRNDLLSTSEACEVVAKSLARWLEKALKKLAPTNDARSETTTEKQAQQ